MCQIFIHFCVTGGGVEFDNCREILYERPPILPFCSQNNNISCFGASTVLKYIAEWSSRKIMAKRESQSICHVIMFPNIFSVLIV